MSGSAGVGILFIQVATVFPASVPALRMMAHTLTVRSPGQEEGPTVTVRSVVKEGPAANSARPPLPGDMLVKVHNSLARSLTHSLTRSRERALSLSLSELSRTSTRTNTQG